MSKISLGTATKSPESVLKTLSDNATVNASPAAGVAATAKGTAEQDMVAQLNQYYQKKAEDTAYADYLTNGQYTQNMNYANYLTNGKYSGYPSYEDYLYVTGQTPGDAQAVRDKTVAQANADYAKAKATYGQTGEQLARSGLTNTGYSDAITNAAYAAKQGAIAQANATKAATDTTNRIGYAQYLQVYDAQQQEKMLTVLEYTTQAGMSEEQAKAYAKAVGFDDTIAESIGKAQAAYTSAVSGDDSQKATDLYNSLVSQDDFTYDPATKGALRQQLLSGGYDSSTVDDVMGRLESNYSAQQEDMYNLFIGALTDDNAYNKVGSMIDGWDEMDYSEKETAIDRYVAGSNMTESQKLGYYKQKVSAKMSRGYSEGDILDELFSYKNIGLSESIYNSLINEMTKYIQLDDEGYPVSIGNTKLSGILASTNNVFGKNVEGLGSAPRGTLKVASDGKLYISRGEGAVSGPRWSLVTGIEESGINKFTDEQRSALLDILVEKLKSNRGGRTGSF